MPSRRRQRLPAVTRRSAELAIVAPEVIARRVLRLSTLSAVPSRRDVAEFQRMWIEKIAAANEAWGAMMLQAYQMNLRFASSTWSPWWMLTPGGMRRRLASHATRTASAVFGAGLVPVHRRAVANARRLRLAQR